MNNPDSVLIGRRNFLHLAVGVTVAPVVSGCGSGSHTITLDSSLPIGPYGAESTAEEVTEGMDLSGQVAVVTGCNSGLGYETLRVLALRGAHVIG